MTLGIPSRPSSIVVERGQNSATRTRPKPYRLDADGQLSDTETMTSFISTRELSKQPGKVMAKVSAEGPQIITQNGVPAAYLIPTTGRGIEADLDILRRLLLGRALDAAQAEAARSGASEMSMDEINAEIAASRRERRAGASAR